MVGASTPLTDATVADTPSSFDGLVSTSNHLLPDEPVVTVRTTRPVWWTMELRPLVAPEAKTLKPENVPVLDTFGGSVVSEW